MMVEIVHWTNIVGKDFRDQFYKISTALAYARSINAAHKVFANVSDEAKGEYQKTRYFMRRCGYLVDDRVTRWHGWYYPYLDHADSGAVKFMTTAPPDRVYIGLDVFLTFKDAYEKKLAAAIEEDRKRELASMAKSIGRDFVPESTYE